MDQANMANPLLCTQSISEAVRSDHTVLQGKSYSSRIFSLSKYKYFQDDSVHSQVPLNVSGLSYTYKFQSYIVCYYRHRLGLVLIFRQV